MEDMELRKGPDVGSESAEQRECCDEQGQPVDHSRVSRLLASPALMFKDRLVHLASVLVERVGLRLDDVELHPVQFEQPVELLDIRRFDLNCPGIGYGLHWGSGIDAL